MTLLKSSLLALMASAAVFGGTSANAAERTLSLAVKNMSCVTCAPTVKRAIARVRGVKTVTIGKIEKGAGIATIVYDDARATPAQLASASTNAGYPATVRVQR